MADSEIKLVLEREVTCPLCMELFKEPKKLPCDHVYCKECLKTMAERSLDATISCPECRRKIEIPNNDVGKFSTDFRLNRLIEAFQKVKVGEELGTLDLTHMCKVHSTQSLALYCETCGKQICRDCVLLTKSHTGHEYGFFKDAAERYRHVIINDFVQVGNQKQPISSALEKITAIEEDIVSHTKKCHDDIDHAFDDLFSVLRECREALKGDTKTYYNSIAKGFKRQRDELEEVRDELNELSTTVDEAVKGNDPGFLRELTPMLKRIDEMKKKLLSLPIEVSEPQMLAVDIIGKDALRHYLKSQCFLHKPVNPNMCTVEGGFLSNAQIDHAYDLIVTLADTLGNIMQSGENKVKVDLFNHQGKSTKGVQIKPLSLSCVKVTLTPETRGKHRLHVKVNGAHVKNSPFSVMVQMPLEFYSNPVAKIPELKLPVGLSYSHGKVIATELKCNRFIEIDSHLCVRDVHHMIGVNKLTRDFNRNTYVTTFGDNQLHKLNQRWESVATVGRYGKGDGEFDSPNGLRICKDDELYVCDSNNHRIQVFDLDLNFKRVFDGKKGNGKGIFESPSDVDFDASGHIYVVDCRNDCIVVFTHDEHFMFVVQNNLLNRFKLYRPMNLCIHNDRVFVTNFGGNNILVLNTAGVKVASFGNDNLHDPEGITVDENGFVYVISHKSLIFVY